MNILIIKGENGYQPRRLMEEGKKRGHTVDNVFPTDFSVDIKNEEKNIYVNGKNIYDYDVIYPFSMCHDFRKVVIQILMHVRHKSSVKVINLNKKSPSFSSFLKTYLEKFDSDISFPKTVLVSTLKDAKKFIHEFSFPIVLRTCDSRRGQGVFLVHNEKELANYFINPYYCYLREYIPNDGDLRVITIGNNAVAAMKRIPKKGEFRANISQGAKGEFFDLSTCPDIIKLAQKASVLSEIEIAGVDIVIHKETKKPYLLEVNKGPQIRGIEKYTKVNIAGKIIEYFEKINRETYGKF